MCIRDSTQGIKTIEEFLKLITQSENITRGENTQHNYQPHGNHNYNHNHSSYNYKPPTQHTQNRSPDNIAHKPTTQRVECGRQEKERSSDQRESRGEKWGYVWPTARKKFSTPYDCPLYVVKANTGNKRAVSYTHLDVYKRQGVRGRTLYLTIEGFN